jgi:hypothetical protein
LSLTDDNIDTLNNSFQQRCRSRSRSDSILTDDCIGAQAIYGGHINYATFLKSVSFFGPNDEYIVSGSDSGHLWIWDSSSGDNDTCNPYKRECSVVNLLKADVKKTCNGVVPHPFLPILSSYGIDSNVKLWGFSTGNDDEEEDGDDDYDKMSNSNIFSQIKKKNEINDYCALDMLPSILDHYQRKAFSQCIRNETQFKRLPFVFDVKQFCITIRSIRNKYQLEVNPAYKLLDIGSNFPSDCIIDFEEVGIEFESTSNLVQHVIESVKNIEFNSNNSNLIYLNELLNTTPNNLKINTTNNNGDKIPKLKKIIGLHNISITSKNNGNLAFRAKDYSDAILFYHKSLAYGLFMNQMQFNVSI